MPHPDFTPIPLIREDPADPSTTIPEDQWSDADRAALRALSAVYDEIDSFRDTERSRQVKIGPSEVGMECDKCFMRKMAEKPKSPHDNGSWKTQVGTYVHAGLQADYQARLNLLFTRFPERRVIVDEYRDRVLDGSCDLFIPQADTPIDGFGLVVDWKIPSTDEDGKGKLKPSATMQKTVKGDIKRDYVVQSNLYGRGYERLGLPVSHVCVFYIPSFGQLWHAKPILMRYDPKWAAWGVARWRAALDEHAELVATHMSAEAAWDLMIEKAPKANFCFSCKRYEEQEQAQSPLAILRGH